LRVIARITRWFRRAPKAPFDWAELGYASLRAAIQDQERILGEAYLRRPTGERERKSRQGEILAICERIAVFQKAQQRTMKP
jgi:hypothetical protein